MLTKLPRYLLMLIILSAWGGFSFANFSSSATSTYDKAGNRTAQTVNGVTTGYTYNANDWLLTAGSTAYTYDANGNTLTQTDGADVTTYVYDKRNKLIKATTPTDTVTYQYAPSGLRTQKASGGVTIDYLLDSQSGYGDVIAEYANGTKAKTYTIGDDLISQTQGQATFYYGYDGLGSTRMLFADTGAVTDSYDYTAFGEIHGETGTTDNAYKFTGEQYDSNVGQYYLRARYYNQAIGRFTQMDTYQGSMSDPASLHKYLYTANDPVNMVDPTGRFGIGGVSLGGMGVSLSTAVSAINTGYRVIGTLDTILSFYQSLHTMYTVMSNKQLLRQIKVLQNSNHKKAEEFVNAVSRTTDALVHLSSNLGKLFTELKNSERVKQFAKNFNFPLVIYGPTPDKTVPWPLKLRMKIGKIGSSRKGRNIILEIGSGKKDRGGRMFGLGHIEGKRPSAHDKQWFRQDWHKTHNAKDLCRTTNNNDGYHYHCMQK